MGVARHRRLAGTARGRVAALILCAVLALFLPATGVTAAAAPEQSLASEALTTTAHANAGADIQPTSATTIPAVRTAPVTPADVVTDGQITVSIDSLSDEVISSDHDLTLTGTLANGTDAALDDLLLSVRMRTGTDLTTAGLGSWLANERDGAMESVALSTVEGSLAPGATRTFSLTISHDDLPFYASSQWGPRGIDVRLLSNSTGDVLASHRTVVIWDAGVSVDPTRISVVVPVVASAEEMLALQRASVTSGTSDSDESGSGGDTTDVSAVSDTVDALASRLTGLLSLAGNGVILAVDPALFTALGISSTSLTTQTSLSADATADATSASSLAAPSATAASSASSQAPPSVTTTSPDGASPSASTSATASPAPPSAATSSQVSGPLSATQRASLRRALSTALNSGDVVVLPWADADISALADGEQANLLTSAFSRAQDEAAGWDGMGTMTALATGPLTSLTLAALPKSITTVVAARGDLPVAEDLTYTPSSMTTINGRTVLVPDPDLTDALAGSISTDPLSSSALSVSSALDVRQMLRAITAIQTRQAPNAHRNFLLTLSREDAATVPVEQIAARIKALTMSAWTIPQSLEDLIASAQVDAADGMQAVRADLPSTQTSSRLSPVQIDSAEGTRDYLDSIASVLTDPDYLLGQSRDLLAWSVATSWQGHENQRMTYIDDAWQIGHAVTEKLTVVPSSTINVIASSADLPLRIRSRLDQPVSVRVHLDASSTRLQATDDVDVTIPAGGEVTTTVPIKAVGSGDVDVLITLLAQDGTHVGTPLTLHARVRADWENRGTVLLASALVVMLVAGLVRTIRRGRRSDADGRAPHVAVMTPPDSPAPSSSEESS